MRGHRALMLIATVIIVVAMLALLADIARSDLAYYRKTREGNNNG